jgi:hypothetical protein
MDWPTRFGRLAADAVIDRGTLIDRIATPVWDAVRGIADL